MDWNKVIEKRLKERDEEIEQLSQVVDCFSELAYGTERLLDENVELKEKCKRAEMDAQEARSELLLTRRSSFEAQSKTYGSSPASSNSANPGCASEASPSSATFASDLKRMAELEARYASLKDERSELYKAQSQNTLKLLELTDQIKQREQRIGQLLEMSNEEKKERTLIDRRLEDYENLIREKNLTIQILQDELTALQLEIINIDEQTADAQTNKLQNVVFGGGHMGSDKDKFEIVGNLSNASSSVNSSGHEKLPKGVARCATQFSTVVPTSNYTCGDTIKDDTMCAAFGSTICLRNQITSDEWCVKMNAKVIKVSLKLLPGKRIILVGRKDGIVSLVSAETHRIRGQLVSPDIAELVDLHVCGDLEHIWTLSPNALKYWHCERSICLRTIPVAGAAAQCMCFISESVGYIAAGNSIIRFSILTGELKQIYTCSSQCIALSAAGTKHPEVFFAAFSNKVMLFQREKPIHSFGTDKECSDGGFFHSTHIYAAIDNKLAFWGLSGFDAEQVTEMPEPIVQVLSDMETVVCHKSIYTLSLSAPSSPSS